MKENKDTVERRQHKRLIIQNVVVVILSAGQPQTIGSITDISLGGARCTYSELRMAPSDGLFHSIDLIADGQHLTDIPCEYVWDGKVESEPPTKLTDIKQCGVLFGRLTPNQIYLLRSFINRCASTGSRA